MSFGLPPLRKVVWRHQAAIRHGPSVQSPPQSAPAQPLSVSGTHEQIAFGENLIVVVGAAGHVDQSDFLF
jgi:hypothetical protein